MALDASDHAMIATAMAIALGLVKALESLITWAVKRTRGKEETTKVELATEPSRMIRETYEKTNKIEETVNLRDGDGIPMVYTPRSSLANQVKMAEAIRDLSHSQDNALTGQAEILTGQAEISRKVDEILSSIKKV